MKKSLLYLLLALFLSMGLSAGSKAEIQERRQYNGMEILLVHSPAIEDNRIDEDPVRTIQVYLPPHYEETDLDYPVVYYLHGYMESAGVVQSFSDALDRRFKEHPDEAFIMVGVDGFNQYYGSFYRDSPITGNWETHIIEELIPLIDGEFRTQASPSNRGIAGFSMGGYGAWEQAFKHPEVFGHLFSASPGAFDETGLEDALTDGSWNNAFRQAYGSVFAPAADSDEVAYGVPTLNGSTEDQTILDLWEQGFGDIPEKLDAYMIRKDAYLQSIAFLYGDLDSYRWISRGTVFMSEQLDSRNIEHQLINHHGGHSFNALTMEQYLLPFFIEAFKENSP